MVFTADTGNTAAESSSSASLTNWMAGKLRTLEGRCSELDQKQQAWDELACIMERVTALETRVDLLSRVLIYVDVDALQHNVASASSPASTAAQPDHHISDVSFTPVPRSECRSHGPLVGVPDIHDVSSEASDFDAALAYEVDFTLVSDKPCDGLAAHGSLPHQADSDSRAFGLGDVTVDRTLLTPHAAAGQLHETVDALIEEACGKLQIPEDAMPILTAYRTSVRENITSKVLPPILQSLPADADLSTYRDQLMALIESCVQQHTQQLQASSHTSPALETNSKGVKVAS
eukprot:TRINITY_DN25096_c1_g1_i1.p1 TRINITY_DN25096_c1_g1~~TRINITY_DN25096_c1_g1_i1.p1  ORF type:complete len:290 (-),score=42.24 TRINITY_DN25096_c1_g1_i1:423-1292(-)